MDLKAQIENDFIEAYKAKDSTRVSVLRMIKSSIKNVEISEKATLKNEDIIRILKKEVKQRLDSANEYEKAGRQDLANKEKGEITIIRKYLPEDLSTADVIALVNESVRELDAKEMKDMGKVISLVMQKSKGSADGAQVATLVRTKLSK